MGRSKQDPMEVVATRLHPADVALVDAAAVRLRTSRADAIRQLLVDATRDLLLKEGGHREG